MNADTRRHEEGLILDGDICGCTEVGPCWYHEQAKMWKEMVALKRELEYRVNYGYTR